LVHLIKKEGRTEQQGNKEALLLLHVCIPSLKSYLKLEYWMGFDPTFYSMVLSWKSDSRWCQSS